MHAFSRLRVFPVSDSLLQYISLLGLPQQNTTDSGAEITEVNFLTVLEARSPRSGGHQVQFFLRPLFLACRWLPFAGSARGPSYACACTQCLCVSTVPSLLKTHWVRARPTGLTLNLIITLKTLIPNVVTF